MAEFGCAREFRAREPEQIETLQALAPAQNVDLLDSHAHRSASSCITFTMLSEFRSAASRAKHSSLRSARTRNRSIFLVLVVHTVAAPGERSAPTKTASICCRLGAAPRGVEPLAKVVAGIPFCALAILSSFPNLFAARTYSSQALGVHVREGLLVRHVRLAIDHANFPDLIKHLHHSSSLCPGPKGRAAVMSEQRRKPLSSSLPTPK